ncbi:Toprim domain-containing protein [Azospirillum brasilense]|uniref:Toprim domain-containing protein n=1 Tax=Azospirillum brasilense TaxID=192 RepID=A0A560BM88_AZOBR|nr:toprim domain-containing protein [Azospirillum brasilense]TWA73735.1 Toprim domain-containing protein [Azospirillum brasilense]
MNAPTIAKALGLSRTGTSYSGRCPCCDYRTGFTVEDDRGRVLVRCHAGGCSQDDVIATLKAAGLWPGELDRNWTPPPRRDASDDNERPERMQRAAADLWRKSIPGAGTLTETYLRGREILLPVPPTLRYRASCLHSNTGLALPAMIAAVTVYPSSTVTAVHRTYLSEAGGKAPVPDAKKTLGPKSGGAIRLAAAGPVLIVGEGIETVLSAMQAAGLPGWSALDAGNLRNLILPPVAEVSEVIICADNDANGIGQAAAEAAATRWHGEGRRVRIALPPEPDTDFNDLLRSTDPAGKAA